MCSFSPCLSLRLPISLWQSLLTGKHQQTAHKQWVFSLGVNWWKQWELHRQGFPFVVAVFIVLRLLRPWLHEHCLCYHITQRQKINPAALHDAHTYTCTHKITQADTQRRTKRNLTWQRKKRIREEEANMRVSAWGMDVRRVQQDMRLTNMCGHLNWRHSIWPQQTGERRIVQSGNSC